MTLRVLIVDDEALARSRLRTLLGDCVPALAAAAIEAANAVQAIDQLGRQPVDLVLLDIHMPGADGLTLARTLRSLPQPPAVVFVTAHAEYAVQAFEIEALDYLTKPVRLDRLRQTLQKVERFIQASKGLVGDSAHEFLVIQERGRTERVPLADVLYFKAELKYITVRTAAKSYILDGSLSELEDRYASQFMRIHRNALVSRRAVRALEKHYDAEEGDGWAVRLHGINDVVLVSRRQLSAVREAIACVG